MKILFDDQIFTVQKVGGISRYFAELNHELNLIPNVQSEVAARYSNNQYLLYYSSQISEIWFSESRYSFLKKGGEKFCKTTNRQLSINKIKAENYDVFHPTYYELYYLDFIKKPFVLTVYDMIHELFPEQFGASDTTSQQKKILCNKADKIIAISHSTKRDLIKFFNIPADKIAVTHLFGGFESTPNYQKKQPLLGLPEKYILFVGGRSGYKNFNRFLQAVTPVLRKDSDLYIVCTGSPFTSEEKNLFEELKLSDKLIHYFCKENDFFALYNNATVFVFPSEYEGFGIPALEAMSSSCPALLANTSSLPEVGGNAALYFNPTNIEDMRETIEKVLYSEPLRNELIQKGLEQAKQFSWKKTAQDTLKIYKNLCQTLQ